MTDLLIFPFNGNGLEALDCISDQFNLIGFVDDVVEKQGTAPTGHPVLSRKAFERYKNAKVLAVPGGPSTFLTKTKNIESLGLSKDRFAQVVHSSAQISKYASLGVNVLIMAGVVLTPKAQICDHVCILPNTVIHHESFIEEYCWIGSNVVIAGNVKVGRNSFIGSGSNIINNISIGERSMIGLGSNVIHSVADNEVVAGNPARKVFSHR